MSTLGEYVVKLHPGAIDRLQQVVRDNGGTYADFMARARFHFEVRRLPYPGDNAIETILYDLDNAESGV